MNATRLGRVLEAVGEAYEDLRVDYDPPGMYLIAGVAATGNVTHDELIGLVMRTHRRLDPVVQLKLAGRIGARLAIAEAVQHSGAAPQRRPAAELHSRRPDAAEMRYGPAGRVLAVEGRRLR